jgi:hypothetical protein
VRASTARWQACPRRTSRSRDSFRQSGVDSLVVQQPGVAGSGEMPGSVVGDAPPAVRGALIGLAQQAEVAGIASDFWFDSTVPQVSAAVRLKLPAAQHQQ